MSYVDYARAQKLHPAVHCFLTAVNSSFRFNEQKYVNFGGRGKPFPTSLLFSLGRPTLGPQDEKDQREQHYNDIHDDFIRKPLTRAATPLNQIGFVI